MAIQYERENQSFQSTRMPKESLWESCPGHNPSSHASFPYSIGLTSGSDSPLEKSSVLETFLYSSVVLNIHIIHL